MINPNEEVEFLAFKEFLKTMFENIGKICEILNMDQQAMNILQADIKRGAQPC